MEALDEVDAEMAAAKSPFLEERERLLSLMAANPTAIARAISLIEDRTPDQASAILGRGKKWRRVELVEVGPTAVLAALAVVTLLIRLFNLPRL